jgi:hypothetical protein
VLVATRARKESVGKHETSASQREGFYYRGLSEPLRESLVEMARLDADAARKEGRQAMQEFGEHKLRSREDRLQEALDRVVEKYARAKELFTAWQQQRAESIEEVDAWMVERPEVQKLEFLRKQIEMRVLGCGWTQYETAWSSSSDSSIGTVEHLRGVLEEIIIEERSLKRLKRLPKEAAPPQFLSRERLQLGTADEDVLDVESRALFSSAELERKTELAMERRRAAGISDAVEDLQPLRAPAFDEQLVGRRIEVLWKYFDKDNGDKATLIWASGRVTRIADGLQSKRSARAKKVLPAGALLWEWDADPEFDEKAGEQWLILLPKKWNKHVHYGWRFDPREFGGEREVAAGGGKRMRRSDD